MNIKDAKQKDFMGWFFGFPIKSFCFIIID